MNKEISLQSLEFDLTSEELEILEETSKNSVCEGGSEGWTG